MEKSGKFLNILTTKSFEFPSTNFAVSRPPRLLMGRCGRGWVEAVCARAARGHVARFVFFENKTKTISCLRDSRRARAASAC